MQGVKAVVVHRGARDSYQVARALAEKGLLEALVTDLYWRADQRWARTVELAVPRPVARMLRQRWSDRQTSARVSTCWVSGAYSLGMSKLPRAPFDWNRRAIRWCDACLGERAGKLATTRDAALLSYSYYGRSAFTHYSGSRPRILFQLHPHPTRMRKILQAELDLHPECAESLNKEWELALPREDFEQLTGETGMAEHWIAASSFTRETLVESGVPQDRIHVVPYGADLERLRPCPQRRARPGTRRLRLLFVGTINQRKGIKYLLDALALLPPDQVELLVCGRVVDDLKIFEPFREQVEIRPSVSAEGLLDAYQSSDVFVFPSLAEGFGHVLLEAMACGLPVVSTTRTGARDLIRPSMDGFLVEPGSAIDLAARIEEFLLHPQWRVEMGEAARRRAEEFTWTRFRASIAEIVSAILRQPQADRVHACV